MQTLRYELRLVNTAASTGFFTCQPADPMEINQALDYLRKHPFDSFMHQYLLRYMGYWSLERMEETLSATPDDDPVLGALLLEACLANDRFRALRQRFGPADCRRFSRHSPLITIRSLLTADRDIHGQWISLLGANITGHRSLPAPDAAGMPPYPDFGPFFDPAPVSFTPIGAVVNKPADTRPASTPRPLPDETFGLAMERLADAGIRLGQEMQHVASLSPVALLREWQMAISVSNGRHDYTLTGIQTAYGRGLELDAARAAYAMEIVERCSAFAGADAGGIRGTATPRPLVHATLADLKGGRTAVVDPNHLMLEVAYDDEPLFWLTGEMPTARGCRPVWMPAQCVFLFSNFDEIDLFSGLGSTGLASGNTPEEARYHGLLEVIERDAEATVTFQPEQCFTLRASDPPIASLLAEYREKGIHVQFQRLDTGLGVPCYKCFVTAPDGSIVKGTAAHLSGRRALVSAMTETPYPLVGAPPSMPTPAGLPVVDIADLPDYRTGDPARDLARLESLMLANGFSPIYVDLTREDLGIPVARAFVPGMALSADFDRFSRVHPRMFRNYLNRQP